MKRKINYEYEAINVARCCKRPIKGDEKLTQRACAVHAVPINYVTCLWVRQGHSRLAPGGEVGAIEADVKINLT